MSFKRTVTSGRSEILTRTAVRSSRRVGEPKSDFTKLAPLWSQVVAQPSGSIYNCTLSCIDAGEEPGLEFTASKRRCEHHLWTHPPLGPEGPPPPRGEAFQNAPRCSRTRGPRHSGVFQNEPVPDRRFPSHFAHNPKLGPGPQRLGKP